MDWLNYLEENTDLFITNLGISEAWAIYFRALLFLMVLGIICAIAYYVTKSIIINNIYKVFKRTSIKWDDTLAETKALDNLAHIVPAIFVRIMAPLIFSDFEWLLPLVIKLTDSYLVIVGVSVVIAFLRVGEYTLSKVPAFKDKPLASYFQLIRIILYFVAFILVLSILLEKSPIYFLSAFGAMTAIMMLIFKDTILGLVASVQMSTNDMIRVGDWVEMPKFNADGDVVEINLHTVKVQNFDKTITTIPTYYFLSESFKNWRGMQQTGGRRIKRAIYVDVNSVKFVDAEMREKLKKYHLITDYVSDRQKEIETYNIENNIDTSFLINGRRMTNLGVYREYIVSYLKNHPRIRQDMSIMVRQLANEHKGIPLEVYCFTNTVIWREYEGIQSDIFDHLYSTASFFDIDIFQNPSGKDIMKALSPHNTDLSSKN